LETEVVIDEVGIEEVDMFCCKVVTEFILVALVVLELVTIELVEVD
jgi:hypothetical protein